jgi:hypothetical protein
MNVNRYLRFCGFFALALLAISIIPSVASAQSYRGKFTLPFAARWGGLTLPAGEYTFTGDSLTNSGLITIEHDGQYLGRVMVAGVSYDTPYKNSELVAVPVGDVYRISVLRLENQCVISFPIPKREREQMTAQNRGPVLARVIAVQPDVA